MLEQKSGLARCALCRSEENVEWCATCRVWICTRCSGNWLARTAAAIKKALGMSR